MKINHVSNNCSFKALMLEKKSYTDNQKKIIDGIKNTVLKNPYYVNLLEHKYTDIYISPNDDGQSVDLKLLSAAGLTYNYVPSDSKGPLKVNLHVPKQCFRDTYEAMLKLQNNIDIRTRKFINRGIDCLLSRRTIPENQRKLQELENQSTSDLVKNRIQCPEIIPDAELIYGEPAVTTKDSL